MTVVLGLAAAVLYGIGDFAGGIASRRHTAVTVLLWSYPVGAVLMTAMLPLLPGHLTGRVVGYGIAGGVVGEIGVLLLYSLMTVAPINIVSPITAVLAAVVPVGVGVVLGERPPVNAWFGIALGMAAVVLVSRTREDHPHGRVSSRIVGLAVLSGCGFGLYFVFLDRAGEHSGLWPLVIARICSATLIVPLALARRSVGLIRGRMLVATMIAGCGDAFANLLFLLAARHGLLSIASVLTSLYPASTVLLAVTVLHEQTTRLQRAGLALAAGAIVLITV